MPNVTFRRVLLSILLLLVAGLGSGLMAFGKTTSSTPPTSNVGGSARSIIGTWMYHEMQQGGHPGAPRLVTFCADGTVIQSAFDQTGISTAQGAWRATGDTSISFTIVSIHTAREEGINGPVPAIQLIQGTARLADSGDAWAGELDRVAIWTLTGWKHIQIPTASLQATRISTGTKWPSFGTPEVSTPPAG
jgi:hypothetical protein